MTADKAPEPAKMTIWVKLTIALVLVAIIISMFTCTFFSLYLNPNLSSPGTTAPTGILSQETFVNPQEGNTTNGGGWTVTVTDLKGPVLPLSKLTVYAGGPIPGGSRYFGMEGVTSQVAELHHAGSNSTWYLHRFDDMTVRFVDDGTVKELTEATAPSLDPEEFATIEGCSIVFFDNDNDANLSIGDSVMAFYDVDADGGKDIVQGHKVVLDYRKIRIADIALGPR